jgi:hypothetical protein
MFIIYGGSKTMLQDAQRYCCTLPKIEAYQLDAARKEIMINSDLAFQRFIIAFRIQTVCLPVDKF